MAVGFRELHSALATTVAGLEPGQLLGSQARTALEQVVAMERLLGGARLLLTARVAETHAWHGDGDQNLAGWLAARTGKSYAEAARDTDTAEALAERSDVAAAVRDGRISTGQASAITDAAKADPGAEGWLVKRADGEALRETRRRAEGVKDAARSAQEERQRSRRQHETRRVRFGSDPDGSWTMDAKLPRPLGAEVQAEIERLSRGAFRRAHAEGRRDPHCAYLADGLVEACRRARGGGGGDGRAPKPKSAVSVIIDLAAMRRGTTASGERCEIAGIGSVPVAWVIDQLGDATLRLFLRSGAEIKTMATTSRSPTEHMRVVLELLHPTCAVCGRRQGLEIHHTTSATGWADTRRTRLVELTRLCTHHHDLVTSHGYALVAGPEPHTWELRPPGRAGPFRAACPSRLPVPPDGRTLQNCAAGYAVTDLRPP